MKHFIQFHSRFPRLAPPRIVAAIGVFDGVHLGHQAVIRAACRLAEESGAEPAALTFDPHPKALFFPQEPPQLLTPLAERFRLLEAAGARMTGAILFSREIAAWEARTFLEEMVHSPDFELSGICVGSRWKFGANGSGNADFLLRFCAETGLRFCAVPEVEMEGSVISSSLIRSLIAEGDLSGAARRMGRLCRLSGSVVRGMGVAAKQLAAPTANLKLSECVLPPDGVYAGQTDIAGKSFPVILNLGAAPTFGVTARRTELHLLGFSGDLYGRDITVELLRKVREIRPFPSPDALRRQIAADITCAQEIFLKYQQKKGNAS